MTIVRMILLIGACAFVLLAFDWLNVTSSFGGAALRTWVYYSVMAAICALFALIWWRFA